MQSFDDKAFEKLSKLCRIECTEEEKEQFTKSLASIIDYVAQLNEVDTDDIPPCNQILPSLVNVMREDEIHGILPRELFLKNAPSHIGGMIRVPPVLKSL
jgi:aspartyl-tRNA(Asn)/glutamyl-tRNA(Gln) amidotransferase subunit C